MLRSHENTKYRKSQNGVTLSNGFSMKKKLPVGIFLKKLLIENMNLQMQSWLFRDGKKQEFFEYDGRPV